MTDRMSNVEIEDVLSSIRRLVSDDIRPLGGPAPAPAPTAARPVPVPRLVLTPALKVSSLQAGPVMTGDAPPPADVVDSGGRVDRDGLANRLAALERLLDAESDGAFEDAPTGFEPIGPAAMSDADAALPRADDAPFLSDDDLSLAPAEPDTAQGEPASMPDDEPDAEDDLPAMDEAFLREIIRDVLREELQGVMGERVTRNLRKLIRAEVSRALSARGIA